MLEVKNLSVIYGNVKVLNSISFQIPDGSNLIILGPNGCGKTTLLRAIASLQSYTGTILLNGVDLLDLSRKEISKKIALMSQFSSVQFDYTVEQTIFMGRYPHLKSGLFGNTSKVDNNIVVNCIKVAGLIGLEKQSIKKLSGGQLQRVFFARALAQNPNMILLDEPTNHLDLRYQAELIEYVRNWSNSDFHMAVGVFHDVNQALQFGDYAVVLKEGYLVDNGYVKDIITTDLLNAVYDMDISTYMMNSLMRWKTLVCI